MNTVDLLWILLPAGAEGQAGNLDLRLTVAIMPRLTTDPTVASPTLGDFPDLLDWPSRLSGATFGVRFGDTGAPIRNVEIVSPPADSALWRALFPATVAVESHQLDDHSSSSLVTNQITGIHQQTKALYGAAGHALAMPDPAQRAALHTVYAGFRRKSVRGKLLPIIDPNERGEEPSPAEPPTPDETQLSAFARYHGIGDPPPVTTPPTEPKLDFHQIVSSLGNFPGLLRLLGLVVDLRVDADGLPQTATLPAPAKLMLVPTLAGFTHTTPCTAYLWDGTNFAIQPTKDLNDPAAAAMARGFYHLDPASFSLVDHDVDSSGLKAGQFIAGHTPEAANAAPEAPPSLRTSGLTLAHSARDKALTAAFARSKEIFTGAEQVLFGVDVVRGFRVDIFDGRPQARSWRALCRRQGSYTFANAPELRRDIMDEGFIQTAVTHGGLDNGVPKYKLSEAIFRWEGWGLSAPHPMTALSRDPDPANAVPTGPAEQPDRFGIRTAFIPVPRTLPTLRFGSSYRTRLRLVNLAGDSVPLESEDESAAFPDAQHPFVYRRHEPVLAPVLALKVPLPTPPAGETIDRLVIRSFNASPSDDATPTVERAVRHVLPPRISQILAERHGMFDDVNGRLRADPDTYALIAHRDAGKLQVLRVDGADTAPMDPADHASIPYWADPLCRGASFRGAPHLEKGTRHRASGGSLTPVPFDADFPDSSALDPIVQIPFHQEDALPPTDPAAFSIILADGAGPPSWSTDERTLTFFLNKGEVSALSMASFLQSSDLEVLGIWQWVLEHDQATNQNKIAVLREQVIDGGHPLITPKRSVTLVHAVQQPIGVPTFSGLAPLTRTVGDTSAQLAGSLAVDGRSTGKVSVTAVWTEQQHPPRKAHPETQSFGAHVADMTLSHNENGTSVIAVETMGSYADGHLSFAGVGALRHNFGDTKYRKVKYRALAASRFEPYFAASSPGGFVREGPEIEVRIPNSKEPDPPKLLYVLPSFGWTTETTGHITTRTRMGGVRIFLSGTWFSSGDDELLAVLFDEGTTPPLPFATQWALDPFWKISSPASNSGLATHQNFPKDNTDKKFDHIGRMKIEQNSDPHALFAGYELDFDDETQRMFVDIPVKPPDSWYLPFLRLALARYQKNATKDALRFSTPVLTDLVQIPPLRSAQIDVSNPGQILVRVTGDPEPDVRLPGARLPSPKIQVDLETRPTGSTSELEWRKADDGSVHPLSTAGFLWDGSVTPTAGASYRILIREIETYSGHAEPMVSIGTLHQQLPLDHPELVQIPETGETPTERVTYADVFDLPSV
jgi:hypothetical protein